MKNILFLILIIALLAIQNLQAQQQIVVQNGSKIELYSNINVAIDSASAGDTLYLPGGSFTVGSISKPIHIIGAGHHPDSTSCTNYTVFYGTGTWQSLTINSGASGGSITGVLIPVTLYLGDYNGCVSNYKIWRCRTGEISSRVAYQWACAPFKVSFFENIMGSVYFANADSLLIFNNILSLLGAIGYNNNVQNNIFLSSTYNLTTTSNSYVIKTSYFANNIFLGNPYYYTSQWDKFQNNTFNNNLFVQDVGFPNGSNIGANNIVNQLQEDIFVNQSGNNFDFSHDYQLNPSSPGNNAGTDGTDIGIYGGVFPWKDGSLPSNPHIFSKTISSNTNPNGLLPINVTVKAQNN